MLNRLFKSRRWPIGLDIGTESIRMLQMQRNGPSMQVAAWGRHRLGGNTAQHGPDRHNALVAGIRQILQEGKFVGREVISALSTNQVKVRLVRLAHMPEDQLAEAVQYEAAERFNFEVALDRLRWIHAGQVRQGNETRDEIIILAVPQETLDGHLTLLDNAGVIPDRIETEPVALLRAFQKLAAIRGDGQDAIVIVDMGSSSTRVTVGKGRNIVFFKEINIGGRLFTEAVAKRINLSSEDAQEFRLKATETLALGGSETPAGDADGGARSSNDVEETLRDAIRAEAMELAKELALCLRYCSVTFRGLRAERVILAGGGAYDVVLVKLLNENLGVNCVVGRPLQGIDLSGVDAPAGQRTTLADWAICAGLAHSQLRRNAITGGSHNAEHRLSA